MESDKKFFNSFYEFKEEGLKKKDFLEVDKNIDLSNINDDFCIHSVSSLDGAKNGDLSFFTLTLVSGNKYYDSFKNTKASFCILKNKYKNINKNVIPIISEEPYITFMRLCNKILTKKIKKYEKSFYQKSCFFPNTTIGEDVLIEEGVHIEEYVKIGNGVKIGENTIIKSGAKIGDNCTIGSNCLVCENCVIEYSEIGDNCCIQANTTIGKDGFGYIFDKRTGLNEKINHFGYVKIGNNVSIGANSCIDRGVFEATIIEDNVKVDNLVQIAHNVKIGSNTMIAGQSGIAGSTTIGKNCMIGGKCGITGHISIGNGCIVYGATNISKSFPDYSKIIGTPGMEYHLWVKKHFKSQNCYKKKNIFAYLRKFIRFKH